MGKLWPVGPNMIQLPYGTHVLTLPTFTMQWGNDEPIIHALKYGNVGCNQIIALKPVISFNVALVTQMSTDIIRWVVWRPGPRVS